MAQNTLPSKIIELFALAENMADGAAANGVAIGVLQNTEARVRADLNAAEAAYAAYGVARQSKIEDTAAQDTADSNGKAFILAAKNVLMLVLGPDWSTAWVQVGFVSSLVTPRKISDRMVLLSLLRNYFTANPGREVAALNVTAAQAAILHTALSDAHSATNAAVTAVAQARAAWEDSRKVLVRRMRGLIYELEQLIAADDPRWYAFGLTPPAADSTPEAPEGLVLTAAANNMIDADWANVPNTHHYRVYVEIVGGGGGFVAVPTTFGDSDATIGPYQPGQVVRVKVTAVSGGLEGPASDVAELTLAGNGGGGSGVPAVPAAPMLSNGPDGQVVADWLDVPGAITYRMLKQLVGTDLDFVDMGLTTISQATFSSLPIGETFRLKIVAINAAGESAPGPYAEIVVA